MLILSVILWMKKLLGALLNYCLSLFTVTNEVMWFLFIKKKLTTHPHIHQVVEWFFCKQKAGRRDMKRISVCVCVYVGVHVTSLAHPLNAVY